jgi:hypothetical protein
MTKIVNESQKILRSLIGEGEVDPFEGLFDDIKDGDLGPIEEFSEEETPTIETAPIVEETPDKVKPVVEEEPTKPVVVEPVVEEEVAKPEVTPEPQKDAAVVTAELLEGFAKQYQLDDETADQFLTDPAVALPKLAAQLHVNILSQVMQLMQNSLPQQITQVQEMAVRRQAIETQFATAWPDLDLAKPDIAEVVTEASKLAKQRYPKADMPELIHKTGLLAHALLGTVSTGQPKAEAIAPKASPQPVSLSPARQAPVPAKAAPKSDWDNLLDDILEE